MLPHLSLKFSFSPLDIKHLNAFTAADIFSSSSVMYLIRACTIVVREMSFQSLEVLKKRLFQIILSWICLSATCKCI